MEGRRQPGSSLSSCSRLSFLGDSQAGQVSVSSEQGLDKHGREWERVPADAAGQCLLKEERETDGLCAGMLE